VKQFSSKKESSQFPHIGGLTFEPDLSTSFDDPLPWDVMPTGMSDIPTLII
jgi:hypothetical protein